MSLQNITLISFGHFEKDFLDRLSDDISHEFQYPIKVKEGHIDLSDYYDPTRRQYNGNKILHDIDTMYSFDNLKTIGIFNVDLFIPILTYIFGQAYLNGRSGVVSLYRLSNERYGMSIDELNFLERAKKEIIHELGHTFGLIHCHTPTCVMRSSTYVEDLDQKSFNFCITCREELAKTL
ncbi:MAG: archaemetzincin family Zn-dependent metalloprotease [Tenuifilaceae bacterium]